MRNRRWLFALVLGLMALANSPASAQQTTYTITGRALDEATNTPLVGVQVSVRGTRFGGLTNGQGRYSIVANLNPGAYTVEAQMIGRETATRAITLGAAGLV